MMGRTHSVHAEPITLGLKLAGWAFELDRGRRRLADAVDEIGTGKISGPGRDVQPPRARHRGGGPRGARACTPTRPAPRSSSATATRRCSPRSRSLGGSRWSGSRPRSATSSTPRSARSRSRSRPARRARRRCPTSATRSCRSGSPASPACSAATPTRRSRTSRSGTSATSATRSAERVILPDATILLDYMLVRMTGLVEGLVVRSERMRENIERGLGLHASSRVLVALVERGGLLARGGLRDRPAGRAPGRRRAPAAARAPRRRPDRRAASSASPTSTPASTTRRSSATSPRSSPDSTAWRQRSMSPASSARRLVPALRQGPRPVRARRRPAAARRVGPAVSAFDVVLPTDDPGQGPRPDRPVAVLVRADRGASSRTTSSATAPEDLPAGARLRTGRRRRAARPDDALPPRRRPADRGHRPRLPRGLRLEGLPADRRGLRHRAAAGLRESDRLPEPLFTPSTKAERRPRREHRASTRTARRSIGRGRSARARRETSRLAALPASGRPSRSRPGSSWPTRSSSSGSCPRPASCSSSTRS